jgi:hypothetical protein
MCFLHFLFLRSIRLMGSLSRFPCMRVASALIVGFIEELYSATRRAYAAGLMPTVLPVLGWNAEPVSAAMTDSCVGLPLVQRTSGWLTVAGTVSGGSAVTRDRATFAHLVPIIVVMAKVVASEIWGMRHWSLF